MPDDEEGRKAFYREKRERAVRWLRGEGLSEGRAQDLVGEAFATLAGSSPRNPGAFLWMTLRNLLAQHRRKERARDKPVEWIRDAVHHRDRLPDEELLDRECRERAEALLMGLPKRQAEVGRLLVDQWTVAEIAEELGIAPSTVRCEVRELRKRLRPLWPAELRPGDPRPDPPDGDPPARRL